MINPNDDQTPSPKREPDESLWASLFHGWVLHYLLPGLIALAVAMWGMMEKQRAEQRKLEKDVEGVRQAVREGKAGDAANRLFSEDYQEYLRRKGQNEKHEDAGHPLDHPDR